MRRLHVLLRAAACVLAVQIATGCGDDPKEPVPEPQPVGQLVDASDCKIGIGEENSSPLPTDRGFVFWTYDVDKRLLRIEHVNAALNCCPEYSTSVTISGGRVKITETESAGMCHCLCLYDFAFEVTDLPVGVYGIKVEEEYLEPEDPLLEGVIDLTQAEFGTIEAKRDHYPWGI